jgi:superfamily II DNA or RNA helicase
MFVVGLSATPERVDGLHTLLELHFGPKKEFIKREEIKDFTVIKYKTKYKPVVSYQIVYGQATLAWTNMMTSIADIKERWIEIAEIAISEPKHKIILLCDRKEMATSIYEYLLDKGEDAELLIGTKKTWDKTKRILVAGVKKGGVGLNDPSLTMLIVAADMKNVKQCEGRIRTTNNIVYDVVDDYKTFESHWSLREKWYLKRGATIFVGGSKKEIKPLFKEPTRFLKPN